MEDISRNRLEKLKDLIIMNNLSELNLDNSYELYDTLLYKTIYGELNKEFISDYLDDSNRDELLGLATKYSSLCFYKGEFDNWVDSIEGVSLSDEDLVSRKLLDNYDYLIRLAKNGGEEVLKFLSKFQGTKLFEEGAIIAELRVIFCDDDVLERILIEMSKEDGNYKEFSDKQKLVLCEYADGVLYRVGNDKKVSIVPIDELKGLISEDTDIVSFEEKVRDVYIKYNGDSYMRYKK